MSVKTSNAYGKISISDQAIAKVTAYASLECYGIVELVSRRFTDSLSQFFKTYPARLGSARSGEY